MAPDLTKPLLNRHAADKKRKGEQFNPQTNDASRVLD